MVTVRVNDCDPPAFEYCSSFYEACGTLAHTRSVVSVGAVYRSGKAVVQFTSGLLQTTSLVIVGRVSEYVLFAVQFVIVAQSPKAELSESQVMVRNCMLKSQLLLLFQTSA